MAQKEFEKFRALVLRDVSLQKRLRETPDRELFIALTIQLGAEHGCSFNTNDVEEALRAARRERVEGLK
jgi:hypothetical protein